MSPQLRRAGFGALVVALVLGAALAPRRSSGPPLDPRSTAPDGTRALVDLLRALGADVELDVDRPTGAGTAIVFDDRGWGGRGPDPIESWVRGGGRLVVADPRGARAPAVAGRTDRARPGCAVAALAATAPAGPVEAPDLVTFGPLERAARCFGGVVVVEPRGRGVVVHVGSQALFTNEHLGSGANAAVAAALLAPEPATVVRWVRPAAAVGAGDRTLVELVEAPVRAGLAQLLVAFGVLVLWRARRLGGPVEEPQVVPIEASELTVAVGRLLQAGRRPDHVASILRARVRADLAAVLGLDEGAPDAAAAHLVAAHTGRDAAGVLATLTGPVRSDAELVALAAELAAVREEVLHVRWPDAAAPA